MPKIVKQTLVFLLYLNAQYLQEQKKFHKALRSCLRASYCSMFHNPVSRSGGQVVNLLIITSCEPLKILLWELHHRFSHVQK